MGPQNSEVSAVDCTKVYGGTVQTIRNARCNAGGVPLYTIVIIDCTSLASMTVPTPTVRADLGTLVTSPPKNLALASMVSTANDLILVRDTRDEPGSLNAMCPSGPIPANQCTNYHQYSYKLKVT